MASRAPTLSKPKTKPKVTTKNILSKAKPTVALKPAAKSPTKTSAKAITVSTKPAKAVVAKTVSSKVVAKVAIDSAAAKSHPAHAAAAKPKLLKTASSNATAAPDAKLAAAASFETAAPKPRRRTKGEVRTRIYWAVFNTDLRRVAVFEFDQRDEAQRRASKLAEASGEHHFIQKIKAIVQ